MKKIQDVSIDSIRAFLEEQEIETQEEFDKFVETVQLFDDLEDVYEDLIKYESLKDQVDEVKGYIDEIESACNSISYTFD